MDTANPSSFQERVRDAFADAAIRALGGRGFDERVGIIQLWESMRLLRTSPISNELILNRVAQQQLRLPRSY